MNNISKLFTIISITTSLFIGFTGAAIAETKDVKKTDNIESKFSDLSDCKKAIVNLEESKILKLCEEDSKTDGYVQFIFGKLYFEGKTVEVNYTEAKEWFEKAKENGSADAISALGTMYYFGAGVDLSTVKAAENYKEAAEKNSSDGQMRYATMLLLGQGGLEKDTDKAREYYIRSARKGNGMSLFHLGYIYFEGIGVDTDYEKSYIYFSAASFVNASDKISTLMGKLNERLEGINKAELNDKAQKYINKYIKPNMLGSDEHKEKMIENLSSIKNDDKS